MSTPIADMVAEMLKNCIPNEMIVLAVRTAELAIVPTSTRHQVDSTIEKRRAWDRNYRRKQRESTRHPPDIHPTSDDSTSLSLEVEEDIQVKEVRKKARGAKLPPDWIPKQSHYDEAKRRGRDGAWVDDKAQDMRIWCVSNSNRAITTKSDWDATFMAWIRKEPNGNAASHNRTNTPAGRATTRETQLVTAVGNGALRYLEESRAARSGGQVQGSPNLAGGNDFGGQPEGDG